MFNVLFTNGVELQFSWDGLRGGYFCQHNGELYKLSIDSSDERLVFVGKLMTDSELPNYHYFLADDSLVPIRIDCESGWKMLNENHAVLKSVKIQGMEEGDRSGSFTFKFGAQ